MIFLQARTGSTRLPKKVLFNYGGEPVVVKLHKRLSKVARTLVVIPEGDTQLSNVLYDNNIEFFEGHPTNVLERFYAAYMKYNTEWITRITCDCPVMQEETVHWNIHRHTTNRNDFTSNCFHPRRIPCGHDVETMSPKMLEWLYENVKDDEHVTSYIYRNLNKIFNLFKMEKIEQHYDMSDIKLSLDTRKDYDRIMERTV